MKEWKAPEKEAQKMTRDGAVSVNLVTGETTYPSDRTPEQDHSASGDTAGGAGGGEVVGEYAILSRVPLGK